jgi:GGDEF domain-containing protein
MLAPEIHNLSEPEKSVVLLCRDPDRRALLQRIVPSAETHSSAIEAMLAVARKGPRAVVVNLQDIEGADRDMVAAVRRARPDVPVYFVVEPADEPAARRLVQSGAGDYFVMPTDVYRLPRVLDPPPAAPGAGCNGKALRDTSASSWAPSGSTGQDQTAEPARERPDQLRLFVSACALADLAQSGPQTILREGAAIIFHALEATRGCILSWDHRTESLHMVAAIGEAQAAHLEQFEPERAAAEQTLRAGKPLLVESPAPQQTILCVPVQDDEETFAVLCISAKRDRTAPDPDDRDAAARLVSIMAKLYHAAVRLDRFATMALRDAETGLLKTEALETYLTKLIGRASTHNAPVTVILLRPEAAEADPTAIGKLGRTIAARLPHGWQGARIDGDRFVVVGAPKPDTQPLPQEVALLYAARSRSVLDLGSTGDVRLRAAVAEFPKDGADARSLLAAAAGRLKEP